MRFSFYPAGWDFKKYSVPYNFYYITTSAKININFEFLEIFIIRVNFSSALKFF